MMEGRDSNPGPKGRIYSPPRLAPSLPFRRDTTLMVGDTITTLLRRLARMDYDSLR